MVKFLSTEGQKTQSVDEIAEEIGCSPRFVRLALRRGILISQDSPSIEDWDTALHIKNSPKDKNFGENPKRERIHAKFRKTY
jgi:hypothetical protein